MSDNLNLFGKLKIRLAKILAIVLYRFRFLFTTFWERLVKQLISLCISETNAESFSEDEKQILDSLIFTKVCHGINEIYFERHLFEQKLSDSVPPFFVDFLRKLRYFMRNPHLNFDEAEKIFTPAVNENEEFDETETSALQKEETETVSKAISFFFDYRNSLEECEKKLQEIKNGGKP